MTSEQQGPTDEVEGHGLRLPPEDETAGDDRGLRVPDDTEGHVGRFVQDPEATEDVEGHAVRARATQDTEAVDEDQDDDTEGHSGHARI